MSEEEFLTAMKENELQITFKNKKDKIFWKYVIAALYKKKIELIKIYPKKAERKIISGQGLEVSKWATQRNYNDELIHKTKKNYILECNII